MSGRQLLRVVVLVARTVAVEVGRMAAATWRVSQYRSAVAARDEHLRRYRGVFGPWRMAHDRAAGVEAPPVPHAPPVGDWLRAAVFSVALLLAVFGLVV